MKRFFLAQIAFSAVLATCLAACGGTSRRPPVASGVDSEMARCVDLANKKKYDLAVECLDVFKSRYPSSQEAAEATLLIADSYFRKKDYATAAETYQLFLTQYPGHPKADYAYYKSGIAFARELPKSVDREQKNIDLALRNFEIVGRSFAGSPYYQLAVDEYNTLRDKLARRNFYVGKFYYRYGEYISAISRFEENVKNYPGTTYEAASFDYLLKALLALGEKEQAKVAMAAYDLRYPGGELHKKYSDKIKD